MSAEPPTTPPRPRPLSSRPELPDGIERPEPPRRDREALPAWPAWSPLPGLLLVFLIAGIGTVIIGVFAELAGVEYDIADLPPGITIASVFVQDLALIGVAILFARAFAGGVTPGDLGIRRTAWLPAVGWTVLVWLTFLVFSAAWASALGITESDDLPTRLGAADSTTALIGVTIMVTLLAPVCEEVFFRGYCFTALRRRFRVAGAAVLCGALFGAVHAAGTEAHFLPPLGVLGALLCLLYWRTGSLIPCMVLHGLNNSIALGVALEWQPAAIIGTMGVVSTLIIAVSVPVARRSAASRTAPA